jgi:hypothetical protein
MKKSLLDSASLLFVFIFLLLSTTAFSQNDFKRNYLYLEAGGTGLFGSVNYERQLTKEPGIGFRIGLGFYTENALYMTIPAGINFIFPLKKDNSFIEAGLGIAWAKIDGKLFMKENNTNGDNFTSVLPSVYYRKHLKNNVMLKAGVTPVFNKYTVFPWIGFALGKSF